jgi:ribulose-phosphate 3-epimerase
LASTTAKTLTISLGVKSDPIETRYSHEWLFRLMAEEGVYHLQLGSFAELYHLEDDYFRELRACATDHGITISSVFSSHRELGGFYRADPRWQRATRRMFERLIEVAALVGAKRAGSNPGSVLRDQIASKEQGITCYLSHAKELMRYAGEHGLECFTMEPMSCLAEPPTLPDEIRRMAEELMACHRATPGTVPAGLCADTSHGYADETERVVHGNLELFEAALPWLVEFHIKNTDEIFNSTFGFTEAERKRGIVDLGAVRDLLVQNAETLPVTELVGYFEIGGPKVGRDYSDAKLEGQLRDSLRYIREVFA